MKGMVVIINNNVELMAALTEVFESEGYGVVSYQTIDLKNGDVVLKDVLDQYKPKGILYDVAIPYVENWEYFKEIKKNVGNTCQIILTTTNKKALEKLVGKTPTIEIISKPFGIEEILKPLR